MHIHALWIRTCLVGGLVMALLSSVVSCNAEDEALFKWNSWFRSGSFDVCHHAYVFDARILLIPGVKKEDAISEIVRCLDRHKQSEQMLSSATIDDARTKMNYNENGLRDKDVLAIALSGLTGSTFEIYTYESPEFRDGKIHEFLKEWKESRKQSATRKRIWITVISALAVIGIGTGVVKRLLSRKKSFPSTLKPESSNL